MTMKAHNEKLSRLVDDLVCALRVSSSSCELVLEKFKNSRQFYCQTFQGSGPRRVP
jgi:hypothetical protein